MTPDESRALGVRVVKECNGAIVKFGRTNGKICLHVKHGKLSRTFFSAADWESKKNPFREFRRKKTKDQRNDDIAITQAVRNREAQ